MTNKNLINKIRKKLERLDTKLEKLEDARGKLEELFERADFADEIELEDIKNELNEIKL